MSSTENTNAIDEKKAEDTGPTTGNFSSFVTNYMTSLIFTIGFSVVLIGTLGLYTTKVAQSNILPDNVELAPFTDTMRNVEEIPIDMHIIRNLTWGGVKNTISQKGFFDEQNFLETFKDTLAGKVLCAWKSVSEPTSGVLANGGLFFSNVYNSTMATNFAFINTFFLWMSYLPESIIMLVYALFGIFIWMGLYFINFFFGAFYHITNILNLFRNTLPKDNTKWEAPADTSFFSFKIIYFIFIWWWIVFISIFVTPIITTFLGLITPLQTKYKTNKDSKTYLNVFNYIVDTVIYKRSFIIILATLSLISNALKTLGSQYMIGIIIAIIISYFLGLYSQSEPELNPSTGFSKNLAHSTIIKAKSTVGTTTINVCPKKNIKQTELTEIKKGGKKK